MTLDVKAHLRELLEAASRDLVAESYVTEDGTRACVLLTMRDHGKRVADVYDETDARLFVAAINSLPALLDRLERAEARVEHREGDAWQHPQHGEMRVTGVDLPEPEPLLHMSDGEVWAPEELAACGWTRAALDDEAPR